VRWIPADRHLTITAIDEALPPHELSAALPEPFRARSEPEIATKLLSQCASNSAATSKTGG
jgi:hypothetical protein